MGGAWTQAPVQGTRPPVCRKALGRLALQTTTLLKMPVPDPLAEGVVLRQHPRMIGFRPLPDDHPALQHSPLLRAAERTLCFVRDVGPIGLTKTKAFKRSFVHWAARHVEWPGWSEEELLQYHKVINEADFPPLELIHFLLLRLKLARHVKDEFRLTSRGKSLSAHRGQLFDQLVPFFLLRVDHSSYNRFEDKPVGSWDIWLNVLNAELATPKSEAHLFGAFYGHGPDFYNDGWRAVVAFSQSVLKPLEWSGLITIEDAPVNERPTFRCAKTLLWNAALELDGDPIFAAQK